VVEDNEQVRETTTALLTELGFDAVAVSSAEAALDLVRGGDSFTFVLSDVMIGTGIDGLELARMLAHSHPHLPVLLATGHHSKTLPVEGAALVVKLRKPYTIERLASVVAEALQPGMAASPAMSGV
jgi:CheY-like chemotaxis protein